jgi:hypothetical protein
VWSPVSDMSAPLPTPQLIGGYTVKPSASAHQLESSRSPPANHLCGSPELPLGCHFNGRLQLNPALKTAFLDLEDRQIQSAIHKSRLTDPALPLGCMSKISFTWFQLLNRFPRPRICATAMCATQKQLYRAARYCSKYFVTQRKRQADAHIWLQFF